MHNPDCLPEAGASLTRISAIDPAWMFEQVFRQRPQQRYGSDLEELVMDIFQKSNGSTGNLLRSGFKGLIAGKKQRRTSYESERSLDVVERFRLSRGQQAAELLRMIEKGRRNR